MDARFCGIEQFPVKFRNHTATVVPGPLQLSRPRKFQRGYWELGQNNCCRFESLASGRRQERHFGIKRKRDSSEKERKRHRPCVPAPVTQVSNIPVPPAQMNVSWLYERLVTAGILPHGNADVDCKDKEEANSIKPVEFSQPETLKIRQPGLVALLHSGIPCSSCGVRFPAEEHMKYRQHLDWHFRQNRRLKDSGANQSRGWHFSVSDWMQFEEIEDPEETGPCWFELQRAANVADTEGEVVTSVSAGDNPDDEICSMCLEKFKNFFNDEEEEWQLLGAVRINGKTFHPLCGEDYKKNECSLAGVMPPPSDLETLDTKIADKTEESTNGSSWSQLMPETKIGDCPS